jgi:hypothetical protein
MDEKKILISSADLEWLKYNYPGMYFVRGQNFLQGCLWFEMGYSFYSGSAIINPERNMASKDFLIIEDAYDLIIDFEALTGRAKVREMGGRILRTKEKWGFASLSDVHMYSDNSLCLCPEPEEMLRLPNGFILKDFIYNLLIPYLYYQSYLEKYGKEPWKSRSHGDLGILESYVDQFPSKTPPKDIVAQYVESLTFNLKNTILSNKSYKVDSLCLCRSNKFFRNCHKEAFEGYKKIFSDYRKVK